ncbi:MAG TPA: hypothetical protein VGN23_04325 [Verrucomicrobiae bacterium]|jgi:Tfp pilus assembly protein PilX
MKIKNTICDLRTAIGKQSAPAPAVVRQSYIVNRKSQKGIALVITLLMLSVTLIMALAFLAISRRERASVTTTTDAANARLATDAALASAEAQVVANLTAGGVNAAGSPAANAFNFGLLVSTNYIEQGGFVNTVTSPQYTNLQNVNYYYPNGAPVGSTGNTEDFLQLLANLYYSPRLPVYIPQNGTNDFRFYLDLNRNGTFEDSGLVPNVQLSNGQLQTNGNIYAIGDPQWIGLLEHPDQPYGPNNKAIARFAFIAVPIGNGLDLNAIHNQSLVPDYGNPLSLTSDSYYRNQGAGTWEINLAAFLADLNTNQWDPPSTTLEDYRYEQGFPGNPPNTVNKGYAFADAFSLLDYRYAANYNTLNSVSKLFNPNSPNYVNFFTIGGVDYFGGGGLQTNFDTNYLYNATALNIPWAGADNTNHFYDLPSDLFNPAETTNGVSGASALAGNDFPGRLAAAGTNNSTYDRYTYYRLLSQLGTDSNPDAGKMNLNYDNIDYTNNAANATNFMPWTSIAFFTNAADRMLKMYTANWSTAYTNLVVAGVATNLMPTLYTNFATTYNVNNSFGISDIPVYVSNRFVYTPAVNRVLQMAANLYESTVTNYYPSVYRPLFTVTNQNGFPNIYITGYTNVPNVIGTNDLQLSPPMDVGMLAASFSSGSPQNYVNLATNIYGVPWVIGARKGFPTFNELVMEHLVGVTRRLRFTRDLNSTGTPVTGTNQMYMFSINTMGGLDFWNSYSPNFNDNVTIYYRLIPWLSLTNSDANGPVTSLPLPSPMGYGYFGSRQVSGWTGSAPWSGNGPNTSSFVIPLYSPNFLELPNSVYRSPNAGQTPGTIPSDDQYSAPTLVPTNYWANEQLINFETNWPGPTPFYIPQWNLLSTNQLQVYILDQDAGGTNHVIDYVQVEQAASENLNNEIFVDDPPGSGTYSSPTGIWNTNINPKYNIPWGIYNQIAISTGLKPLNTAQDGTWEGDPEAVAYSSSTQVQQADFAAFFLPYGQISHININGTTYAGSNYEAAVQAPYSPTRYAFGYTLLQANDPLVHYLASDMTPSFTTTLQTEYDQSLTNLLLRLAPAAQPFTLGQLNYNFQPWGGNPYNTNNTSAATLPAIDVLAHSLEERDPGMYGPDDWDFPTNKLPNVGWIGRVHRGTPWQTVYMKSTDMMGKSYQLGGGNAQTPGINVWAQWTGDQEATYNQFFDAANSAPNQDRLLFDLFTTGINDNATRGQLSVNSGADQFDATANPGAGLAGWSAVLSGVVVPPVPGTTNSYTVISPAGAAGISTNSAMGMVVSNINFTRANYPNLDGTIGTFEHKGDILGTPMLTVSSPFLNLSQSNGFNDEMYEWVPQQIMGLLRGRSMPRYVIYCYGQTLQPAPNGYYTGGTTLPDGESVFGMVTNYQVTAESATKVVLRIDGLTDASGNPLPASQQHPHAVIESINTLPPD